MTDATLVEYGQPIEHSYAAERLATDLSILKSDGSSADPHKLGIATRTMHEINPVSLPGADTHGVEFAGQRETLSDFR